MIEDTAVVLGAARSATWRVADRIGEGISQIHKPLIAPAFTGAGPIGRAARSTPTRAQPARAAGWPPCASASARAAPWSSTAADTHPSQGITDGRHVHEQVH